VEFFRKKKELSYFLTFSAAFSTLIFVLHINGDININVQSESMKEAGVCL
jgi:hypothetical protein